MLFNKRASLELSIQAIVIVVLAMTILGLGLGVVRSIFVGIKNTGEQLTEQIKTQIQEDLRTGDKKVSFPQSEIKLDKGESVVLGIGIYNKKDTPLHYKMRFTPINDQNGAPFTIDSPTWFQFDQSKVYISSSAESQIRSIKLTIPKSGVPAGSYFLTFEVLDDDLALPENVYEQKDIFIVVRG